MADEYRMEYTAAVELAKMLRSNNDVLRDKAAAIPDSVDGGDATETIMEIVSNLLISTSTIIDASANGADAVERVVDSTKGFDEDVEAEITALTRELE